MFLEFGYYATIDEDNLNYQRIVQLGWVVSKVVVEGELALSKEFLVKPEGFDISTKATGHHKINHSQAVEEGRPLRDVLEEFMRDVIDVHEQGGRVVAHQVSRQEERSPETVSNTAKQTQADQEQQSSKNAKSIIG